jgi:hypothetical protein
MHTLIKKYLVAKNASGHPSYGRSGANKFGQYRVAKKQLYCCKTQ